MRVCFLHPDLGIGGAERLVVDAAVALKSKGHKVKIITNHHEKSHSFTETHDGTLEVITVCDYLPRALFGRLMALFAYVRLIIAAIYLCIFHEADIVFVDQIAVAVPFIRILRPRVKILFYCHFPDQLLSTKGNLLKRLYRLPLDFAEQFSTALAHCVMVNSHFTESIFRSTFRRLGETKLEVVYPTLNLTAFQGDIPEFPNDLLPNRVDKIFMSLNRYERKKNIALSIRALGVLRGKISKDVWDSTHLIIAGGYDSRVRENVNHYNELVELTDELQLADHVTFLQSPNDNFKRALLAHCHALIYTPSNEHFGIVPIEAMYSKRPVIAVNSGGPLETVEHGTTGFLCDPKASEFCEAMRKLLMEANLADRMGFAGRERVEKMFLFPTFVKQLDEICKKVVQ